eukprot:366336-Chlamydomonas_euryale.AAC.30
MQQRLKLHCLATGRLYHTFGSIRYIAGSAGPNDEETERPANDDMPALLGVRDDAVLKLLPAAHGSMALYLVGGGDSLQPESIRLCGVALNAARLPALLAFSHASCRPVCVVLSAWYAPGPGLFSGFAEPTKA